MAFICYTRTLLACYHSFPVSGVRRAAGNVISNWACFDGHASVLVLARREPHAPVQFLKEDSCSGSKKAENVSLRGGDREAS